MKDVKENEIISLFDRKDYIYWIIYLLSIIVLLLVWKWDDEQQLTNQISLVGSVSSILLALVAIGYAFFQSNSSSNENKMMLQTLTKINDEITKLEQVNTSLSHLRSEFVNMKDESSIFQEKMEIGMHNLKTSLEDKSWIDEIKTQQGEEISTDLKVKLKEEYENHIEKNLGKAFQIDNEIMAGILSYIYKLQLGEKINEEHLSIFLNNRNIKHDSSQIMKEFYKLTKTGLISLLVDEKDKSKKIFAKKTGQPQLAFDEQ